MAAYLNIHVLHLNIRSNTLHEMKLEKLAKMLEMAKKAHILIYFRLFITKKAESMFLFPRRDRLSTKFNVETEELWDLGILKRVVAEKKV